MARAAILWHLHQPEYRDPRTGRPVMPWTRLHALRGYRDIAVETAEAGAAVTVNLVPSFVDQLLGYAAGGDDRHLELTSRHADDLLPAERDEIRGSFVCGNPVMIEIHPAYRRLARQVQGGALTRAGDLRDLQVWSTLAWFGATALRDYPSLVELRHKGVDYTEDDKRELLRVQREVLAELPGRFARLAAGPARLSTTPYFHPILPLIVDASHARRCMPGLPDEVRFAWPQDALAQLVRARSRMKEVFGSAPVGLWPSEGSVSPEVVELAARAGFRWLATDEGVLHRSEHDRAANTGGWDLGHGVRGFFRDRDLSDRIGFQYARREPAAAVAELLGEVRRRAGDGLTVIALDGENPWEAFPDAGAAFRAHLHAALREGPVRGVTLDDAAAARPAGRVHRLHTGSWIGADFRIWIGHRDDRRAWKLLARTREAVEVAESGREAAMEHVYAAEGSDWTWWYGEDFSTPFAHVFDRLFRDHLRAAWEAIGQPPPPELDQPIHSVQPPRIRRPVRFIDPSLDAPRRWLDWAGSGSVSPGPQGAMATGARFVDAVRFGWSEPRPELPEGALWLRVELPESPPTEADDTSWLIEAGAVCVTVPYRSAGVRVEAPHVVVVGVDGALVARVDAVALPAGQVPVAVVVVRGGSEQARFPTSGPALLARPVGPDVATWFV